MADLRTRLAEEYPDVEVWAAGGLVMRAHEGELQVLLVHRPHRSDWSFPKGKVDEGETLGQTAVREVEEETGFRCRRIDRLAVVRYTDPKDREKLVVYWTMEVRSGAFAENDEVDVHAWCSLDEAASTLTYERDAELLDAIRPADRQLRLLA